MSPFDEGAQAFLEGYADDLNPYQAGTALAEEWSRGWDTAYARFLERNAA